MNIKEELKNDFQMCCEKIDFTNYNPNSNEFQKLVSIGVLYFLLNQDVFKDKITEKIIEKDDIHEKDLIDEKLFSAKKYIQKYIDTRDITYKNIAKDELTHIDSLIKKSQNKLLSLNKKEKLDSQKNQYQSIYCEFEKLT